MDMVWTHFGFVVLAMDGDMAWIEAYNSNGTSRWYLILHDNGSEATEVTD
jgi:hypothetical protein